ncbi:MAG: AraC family transcriptional regulator [Chitinophagaceae bacterium]|nr:AraC family transcriptional regulator [Chitinophagaceae bacterium]
MNQFFLQQGRSGELQLFPHIVEFALKKNYSIQLNSLPPAATESIRIYCITEGKFEWAIQDRHFTLYPGDITMILPGQKFGGSRGFLDIGTLSWIHLQVEKFDPLSKTLLFGKWSSLSKTESFTIAKILMMDHAPFLLRLSEAENILLDIKHEILNQEIGYATRANHLIDELFILLTRQLTRQNNPGRDFPQTFMKLEQTLRKNLNHQWTVEEMAALVGLGTTAFNERVKKYTGFSPLNYLINIRISEAIKMLKRENCNVTEIALETGFYSSQHFSTTFKKLTGYTPSEFRKKNILND